MATDRTDALDTLLAELRQLRREITELRRPRRTDELRLLTKRAAARRLGVDRSTTLEDMIADGRLATVPWGDTVRIPVSEIERIEAHGLAHHAEKAPAQPRAERLAPPRRAAPKAARAIMKIPLD